MSKSDTQLTPLQKARHCSLMTTLPSGVKNQKGILSCLLSLYSTAEKLSAFSINAFKPVSDKPIVSSTIPLSLSNLCILLSWEEMPVLLMMSFHLEIQPFFSLQYPEQNRLKVVSTPLSRKV